MSLPQHCVTGMPSCLRARCSCLADMASNLVPLRNAEHHTTHSGCYRPPAVAASARQGSLLCQLEIDGVALLL